MFGLIGKVVGAVVDKFTPVNKDKVVEGQNAINLAEVSGGPASLLRLWRSFLGWILTLILLWEVVARTIVLTYWPQAKLPPSMWNEAKALLWAMLGLGL